MNKLIDVLSERLEKVSRICRFASKVEEVFRPVLRDSIVVNQVPSKYPVRLFRRTEHPFEHWGQSSVGPVCIATKNTGHCPQTYELKKDSVSRNYTFTSSR